MGYRVGRVSLHAVSRWSRSPGCCGYISWCVFVAFGGISFFFRFLYFECARPTVSTRQPCLMYLSTSNEARRPRPFLAFRQKSLFISGCVQGAIIKLVECMRNYVLRNLLQKMSRREDLRQICEKKGENVLHRR